MNRAAKPRDLNIDAARGLGLALMIYSHLIIMGDGAFGEFVQRQWQVGAAWRMPFMFFVSGLAHAALADKRLDQVVKGSLTLGFTAILVNLAGLTAMLASGSAPIEDLPLMLARTIQGNYHPVGPMWFLTALALVRVAAWAVLKAPSPGQKALLTAGLVIAGYYAASVLGNLLPLQGRAFAGAFAMFMLGQGWTRGAWGRLVWLIPLALLTPALNVEFAGGPLFVSHSAVSLNSNLFGAPPLFAVSAVAGCAMLWRIVCLTPDAARPKLWAAAWGRRAINVLIVHGLVTWAARTWFGQGVELSSPAALVSWTLACVALTVLHEPLRRALQPVLNRLHEIASWMAEAGTTSMRAAGERRSDQVAGGLACAPPVQSTN